MIYYDICAAVLFGIVGVCIGSFCNVVIYRLPRGMSLAKPPSHCPSCGHKLAPRDNIPLLSFLFLRGKCRYCGAPISPRYFFVELANGALWLAVFFLFYGTSLYLAGVYCIAVSVLLCIALCDEENFFIPDSLQLALALTGIAALIIAPGTLTGRLLGALVGGGFYLLFYCGSLFLSGREGLGFGDVKLMAAAGLLLGLEKTVLAIFLGAMLALVRLAFDRGRSGPDEASIADMGIGANVKRYPLAPALAAAAVIAMLCGDALIGAYFALFV